MLRETLLDTAKKFWGENLELFAFHVSSGLARVVGEHFDIFIIRIARKIYFS